MEKMIEKPIATTREKILKVAAKLFSESGYKQVTTRDIAGVVGIKSASIYYHFSSKGEILRSLYKYYTEERGKATPDVNGLLKLAETAPPHEVLMRTNIKFDEENREYLDQILVTASREIGVDAESESFIKENIFDSVSNLIKPLLARMVELGKIKPLNVDDFINVLAYYHFGAAALSKSSFGSINEKNIGDLNYIFSLIIPIEKK